MVGAGVLLADLLQYHVHGAPLLPPSRSDSQRASMNRGMRKRVDAMGAYSGLEALVAEHVASGHRSEEAGGNENAENGR